MKKILYFLIIFLAIGVSSCKKFLDQVPDDVITVEDIFKSKANTDKFLANIYFSLPNEQRQRYVGTENSGPWTASSDEAKYNWDFNYSNNMNSSVWSNTDGSVATYWNNYYKAIRNATYFIQNIDNANPDEVNSVMKLRYKAEAKALRAIYYFYLVRSYGPVIIIGDDLIDLDASFADLQIPRTPFDQCIDYIVTELDAAATDLDTIPNNSEYGRITKGVAKAYAIEALLLNASPLWNGNADFASFTNLDGTPLSSASYDGTKWEKAARAAKAFIEEFVPGTYELYKVTNADPFIAAYLSCRNVMTVNWNKEWIYARSNSGDYMRYDRTPKHVGFPSGQQGGGALGVTQTMVDAYFMANGYSINDNGSGYQASGFSSFKAPFDVATRNTYNQWINREPRFYVGVTYNNSYWLYQDNSSSPIITNMEFNGNSGRSKSTSDVSPTGYVVRKSAATNNNARGGLYLRLANIYLDYAEALNEYNESDPDILKYLNLIRERAGIPQYGAGANALPVPSGKSAMREAIRKERRVELAFENVRFFDTRRWKIAEVTDSGPFYGMNMTANGDGFYAKTQTENRVFRAERDYLFPIPNSQVLINAQMVQNPGW